MKTVSLDGPSPDRVRFADVPDPGAVGPGQALVRVRAAAFNDLDRLVANGGYPGALYPNVPVANGAGEVVAVGDEVDTVAVGDRIAIHPKSLWVAGRQTARTAYAMRGVTTPGVLSELMLVDTATLVKATGARVIVSSSSDAKLDRPRALGADHGINYRTTPQWQDEVLRLTDGVGADLVLETTGTETFARSLAAARHGGTVYAIGFVSGAEASVDLLAIIGKAPRVIGGNTGSAADLAEAMDVVAAHALRPTIARTFPVRDIHDAYAALLDGERFGKLAVTLDWSAS